MFFQSDPIIFTLLCTFQRRLPSFSTVDEWLALMFGDEEDRNKRWIKEAIEIRKRRGRTMNRDDGQYQFTHTFDEFLVPMGPKSPTGKTNGQPSCCYEKLRRQTSTPVTHLVLRMTVVSVEMYTVSGINWIRFKEHLDLLTCSCVS